MGHKQGMDVLENIVKACIKNPQIKYLSVYALSTENTKRDQKELKNLFKLIEQFSKKWKQLAEKGVKVKIIGDITFFPKLIQKTLKNMEEKTKNGKNLLLIPALHYGGRDEILRAIEKLYSEGNMTSRRFQEDDLKKHLDTADIPNIDLLIRTGGKKRLSNFMLWQSAYAELYFLDKLWPDFTEKDLNEAIEYFKNTQRNFGK